MGKTWNKVVDCFVVKDYLKRGTYAELRCLDLSGVKECLLERRLTRIGADKVADCLVVADCLTRGT